MGPAVCGAWCGGGCGVSAAAGGAEPELGPTQEISPSPRSSVVDSSDSDSDSVRRPEIPQ
eukprot:COSAG01_NODE_65897_length_272_cov_0.416185_1_plen_59_part_10